jgi:threonine/homoserine efflux transporter RhtA
MKPYQYATILFLFAWIMSDHMGRNPLWILLAVAGVWILSVVNWKMWGDK